MSVSDVIKKSVLEKFQVNELSTTMIIITMGMSIILGMFIYFIYRVNSRSGFYNRGFNKSLAILPLITAAIMMAMSSNITISLGMVGALSIVRFRNAIKDPIDLTFLFWSITTGIVVGAGIFELAILLSLAVAVLVTGMDFVPHIRRPLLLVISAKNPTVESELISCVKEHSKSIKITSRNISKTGTEWIFEMFIKNSEESLIEKLYNMAEVTSVHLMTQDGEVRV